MIYTLIIKDIYYYIYTFFTHLHWFTFQTMILIKIHNETYYDIGLK